MAPANSSAAPKGDVASQLRSLRPIDLVHLAKQCLGDENLEYEVLRMFDTTIASYLSRLQSATSADEIKLALHSIKGASGGVGAWNIAELARATEGDLRNGSALTAEHLSDLSMAVEEVRAYIGRVLETSAE